MFTFMKGRLCLAQDREHLSIKLHHELAKHNKTLQNKSGRENIVLFNVEFVKLQTRNNNRLTGGKCVQLIRSSQLFFIG